MIEEEIQSVAKHRICKAGIRSKLPMRYDVTDIKSLKELREQIRLLVGPRVLEGNIATFGSCFAVNVGKALKERGRNVYTLLLTEEVNSPFNNVLLLRKVFLDEDSQLTDELKAQTRVNYFALKEELVFADTIILTLGNIFHLESDGKPTVNFTEGAKLVAEDYEETVRKLREIFSFLNRYTRAKLYVTVSPIPIQGYVGREFKSAIEADCASKSQLRAALRECSGFEYLPIFEVFKWLPPHQHFPTFGVDDGRNRHLAQAQVGLVMEMMV